MKPGQSPFAEFFASALFFLIGFRLAEDTFLPTAIAFFVALAAVSWLFGEICGAHVNPAVTTGFVASGQFPLSVGLFYLVAQLLGGIAGVVLSIYLSPGAGDVTEAARLYIVERAANVSFWKAFSLEVFGGFVLVLGILLAKRLRTQPLETSLAIGGSLGLAIWLVGEQSGGAVNPVRALAPLMVAGVNSELMMSSFIVYVLSSLIGGLIAGLLYRALE